RIIKNNCLVKFIVSELIYRLRSASYYRFVSFSESNGDTARQRQLAIDDNDSCDSSSTKRKVVHVGGDKSKNIPHANVSIVVPIISLTILFVTTTSSVPEVANTARVLKDVDCSSDSNSEKQLVIDEQIVDDCDDDDVQTDNNKIFQAHFILETIDSGILMVNFLL
ncbi:unnamed protein product, partial [Rotaria magnacalcarata]